MQNDRLWIEMVLPLCNFLRHFCWSNPCKYKSSLQSKLYYKNMVAQISMFSKILRKPCGFILLMFKRTIRYPFRYSKPVSIFDIWRRRNVFQIIIATDLADAKVIGSRKCHPLFIWFSIQTIGTFGGIIKSIICHILSIVSQGWSCRNTFKIDIWITEIRCLSSQLFAGARWTIFTMYISIDCSIFCIWRTICVIWAIFIVPWNVSKISRL